MTKSQPNSDTPLKIEAGKEYLQRNGQRFRVYAVDGGNTRQAVHGAVLSLRDGWVISSRTSAGFYYHGEDPSPLDLVALAPRVEHFKKEYWVCVDTFGELKIRPKIAGHTFQASKLRIIGERTFEFDIEVPPDA